MLLSEIPPTKKVNKTYLIHRNRIQAALADYVIVIETAKKGGTIKTISYAEKLNKPVLIFKPNQHQLEIIKNINHEIIKGNYELLNSKKYHPFSNEYEVYSFIKSKNNFLFPELKE